MRRKLSSTTESIEIEVDDVEDGAKDGDRQFITALARGLDVLRAFRPNDPPLSNLELAKRTGLPKPTISRMTHTLRELGYLTYHEQFGCYELGGATLVLAYVALANLDNIRKARPAMLRLAEATNASVGFGTRERTEMVYLEACLGPALVGLRLNIGSRVPIVSTSMGRAYVAALEPKERVQLVNRLSPKSKKEESQILHTFELAADELKTYGFCVNTGDWQHDIHGIAAPISIPEMGGFLW